MKVCPVNIEYQDLDWNYIIYEFNMNYSLDSIRLAYQKTKKESEKPTNDLLRELGYTDDDLLKK